MEEAARLDPTGPSDYTKIQLTALVVLRMLIGWHFLYEGVWKIVNADKFSAAGFLGAAKGPAAPLFYWMVADIDGRERLKLTDTGRDDTDPDYGDRLYTSEAYANAWARLHQKFVDKYQPSDEQAKAAEETLSLYDYSLERYLTDRREEIEGYFGSLQRLEERKRSGTNRTAQRVRIKLPDGDWRITQVDLMAMTTTTLADRARGTFSFDLPDSRAVLTHFKRIAQ